MTKSRDRKRLDNGIISSRIDIPPVTKNLLVINIMLWLVEFIFPGFAERTLLPPPRAALYRQRSVQSSSAVHIHVPARSFRDHAYILQYVFALDVRADSGASMGRQEIFCFSTWVCGVGAAFAQEAVWAMTWRHEYVQGHSRAQRVDLRPHAADCRPGHGSR